MGGHKGGGPSGPSLDEQYQTAKAGYQSRARDVAAEGGGQIDVEGEKRYTSPQEAMASIGGKSGQSLAAYKQRMEAKFKAPPGAGGLRDSQARGPGIGSTNVEKIGAGKPKQFIGEEDEAKKSFFA